MKFTIKLIDYKQIDKLLSKTKLPLQTKLTHAHSNK